MDIANVYTSNINARILRKKIAPLLGTNSLIYGEFEILYLLKNKKQTQPSIIGSNLGCEPASISRSIRQLHLNNYVSYDHGADDRRKVVITITKKGSDLVELISKSANKLS